MILTYDFHTLDFIVPAKTSRGEYVQKKVMLISLIQNGKTGIGEASPLPDLSIDGKADLKLKADEIALWLAEGLPMAEVMKLLVNYPSLQFALECANLQLQSQNNSLFQTDYTKGKSGIRTNGLVWMSPIDVMTENALRKAEQGFSCIKFKVGAHDHDAECRMLEKIRKKFSAFKLEIRLDANGAFSFANSTAILNDLKRFEVHSLEQPIAVKQWDEMQELCAKSPIKIALDEELIGLNYQTDGKNMLAKIKPDYIILKPTLLGGFNNCNEWIHLAKSQNIGWWATSALESNVGLGHISEWVSTKQTTLAQGLGTGSLYKNNFKPSTKLEGEMLWHLVSK